MTDIKLKLILTFALATLFAGVVYPGAATADLARSGQTVLVSAFSDGTPADGGEPSVSADGRYVAFASWDKLLPAHRNECQEVYRKDMTTGELLLISSDKPCSNGPSISADGNKVLFISGFCERNSMMLNNYCSGFVAYVRDVSGGTTIQVSSSSFFVGYAKISADGNYAIVLHIDGWRVWSARLVDARVPFDWSTSWFIATLGLSVPSFTADLSADGRYVVFESEGKHVAQDTDREPDVYLFDRLSGAISLVGIHPSGQARLSGNPSISADGNTVVFRSDEVWPASNVYARHLPTAVTVLVSEGSSRAPAFVGTFRTSVSGDGNLVAFDTLMPHLSVDTNPDSDVFLRDVSRGKTKLVSILPDGTQGIGNHWMSDIPDDGRFVAFESRIDPELPQNRRVYLRDLQPSCTLALCPLDYL